ncbi:hypothetical protein LQZ19_12130 [Treponema primitia]|uniref:hypothetical protein n=1 Tax=Treponema primitia TaxID=88058 RepID=UPI00398028EF
MMRKTAVVLIALTAGILLCFCTSSPAKAAVEEKQQTFLPPAVVVEEKQKIFLPPADGWYLYDFDQLLKNLESEYTYAQAGITLKSEVIKKQRGTIAWCEDGVVYDPVLETALSVDSTGNIHSPENATVKGLLKADGSFYWTGMIDQPGGLTHTTVTGKLTAITNEIRAGKEFDGLFLLTDNGTGRKQVARAQDGFYTWRYDDDEEVSVTPWPMLIHPDGTLDFSLEMIVVMELGGYGGTNFGNTVSTAGRIIPGEGISMEISVVSSGLVDTESVPDVQAYGKVQLYNSEVPNDAIPQGVDTLIKAKAVEIKKRPAADISAYPGWYIQPPSKQDFIYASGYSRFENEKVALDLAEAAAAAEISAQIKIRVQSETLEITTDDKTRIDSKLQTETTEKIVYKVLERVYRSETGEAFALLEFKL